MGRTSKERLLEKQGLTLAFKGPEKESRETEASRKQKQ